MALPDEAPAGGSRLRDVIRPALFEATFVVFGVILALAANEWRESRQRARDASVALSDITAELRANRAIVVSSLGYHQSLLGTLRSRRDSAGSPGVGAFPRGFISPAQGSSTAWVVAGETGVTRYMSYPTVLRLSRVYALQGRYDEQAQAFGQVLYGEMYRSGPEGIAANYRHLVGVIGSFWYRERQLLALYDSTLAAVAGDSIPTRSSVPRPHGAAAGPAPRS